MSRFLNKFSDNLEVRGIIMIKLFELRAEKGLSQRAVAKQLNISQGTYNNWENGKTQPSIEQLKLLAAMFDVTVDYLIGYAEENVLFSAKNLFSEEEEYLLKNFRSLNAEAKSALIAILKNLK